MNLLLRLLALPVLLLVAAPAPAQGAGPAQKPQDLWADADRTERGAAMLTTLLEAHGGTEAWRELGGLRLDMLESARVLLNRNTGEIKVHHRLAQLCWFTPDGDGFVRAEYVKPDGFTPLYRREVVQGKYAWAEVAGDFLREPAMAVRARAHLRHRFLISAFPFSVPALGGELIFLKDLPAEGDPEGQPSQSLYGLRLGTPVIMAKVEETTEFALIVDNATNRVVQLQYSLYGKDKFTLDRSTECYVDFEYGHELEGVVLPERLFWWSELDNMTREYLCEDLRAVAVPPAALRRPWQAGTVYETEERADHWDPPAKEPEPADGESGEEPDGGEQDA